MTRVQRAYFAVFVVGFIVSLVHAWTEREYLICGVRNPGPAQSIGCREDPVLDRTEFLADFAVAMGYVGLFIFVIWLILWVMRGK